MTKVLESMKERSGSGSSSCSAKKSKLLEENPSEGVGVIGRPPAPPPVPTKANPESSNPFIVGVGCNGVGAKKGIGVRGAAPPGLGEGAL
jgi:hypothetical protein